MRDHVGHSRSPLLFDEKPLHCDYLIALMHHADEESVGRRAEGQKIPEILTGLRQLSFPAQAVKL